ncbi:Uncharacterised protein [Staphylococcus condimenti]|nr:Uncharacterised protein [Staphylococcus condimenti]
MTVLYIMRKEKYDRSHDYCDKLILQEQLDRIENIVKTLESELCTDEWHRSKGHKPVVIDEFTSSYIKRLQTEAINVKQELEYEKELRKNIEENIVKNKFNTKGDYEYWKSPLN